jgi:hypothetical protein
VLQRAASPSGQRNDLAFAAKQNKSRATVRAAKFYARVIAKQHHSLMSSADQILASLLDVMDKRFEQSMAMSILPT